MRDTAKVARVTKKAINPLIGRSVRTVITELFGVPIRCSPNTRMAGMPKAIAAQIKRRLRSVRPQGLASTSLGCFESGGGANWSGNSVMRAERDSSGKEPPPVGKQSMTAKLLIRQR